MKKTGVLRLNWKKGVQALAAFVVAAALVFVPFFGSGAAPFSTSRLGDLTLYKTTGDEQKTPVEGAIFAVYHVAYYDDVTFDLHLTNAFAASQVDVKGLSSASQNEQTARKLTDFANANGAVALMGTTDRQGSAFYGDLPVGLYLVEEKNTIGGWEVCAPFLIALPEETDGQFVYSVTARPKTPGSAEFGALEVKKTVAGNHADTQKAFTFTLRLYDETGAPLSGQYAYSGAHEGTFDASEPFIFSLSHGQTLRVSRLPAGSTYIISESDYAGYKVTWTGASGMIQGNKTAIADILNTRNANANVPTTGYGEGTGGLYALALCAVIWTAVAGWTFLQKRRKS